MKKNSKIKSNKKIKKLNKDIDLKEVSYKGKANDKIVNFDIKKDVIQIKEVSDITDEKTLDIIITYLQIILFASNKDQGYIMLDYNIGNEEDERINFYPEDINKGKFN